MAVYRPFEEAGSKITLNGLEDTSKGLKDDRCKIGSLDLTSMGIGTISWFTDNRQGRKNIDNIIESAVNHNCDFFDTAERYGSTRLEALGGGWGSAERTLGMYIDRGIKVATKFTPTPWRRGASSVVEACEKSCRRLGVSSVDLYQIHMPDIVQPFKLWGITNVKDEEYWEGLADCYRRGLAKNVGVSNYGPTLLLRASVALAKRGVPLVSNQVSYSLLYRGNGAEYTLDIANEMGVQTLAYYPLAMGLLSEQVNSKRRTWGREDGGFVLTKCDYWRRVPTVLELYLREPDSSVLAKSS
eukprot:gene32558-39368_t